MAMLDAINRFVDTMAESQAEFQRVKLEIDRKDRAVSQSIEDFRKEIGKTLSAQIDTADPDIRELFDRSRKQLLELLDHVAEDVESTRKGMEFIKKYEQTFNVAVFGKVKAGKSYLGNFIMGNQIRDLGIATSYDRLPRPTVEVYDRGKMTRQAKLAEFQKDRDGNESFYVDPNEATAAIQLFHLGALSWFDTPGIGSVTWENEMLAKDYVDNADLVVYTSNSDAAGTRQDFKEMKELYQKGKQFLLLLTQSDTLEEDYDEETDEITSKLTAKSEKDRRDTEQYMRQTLAENGIPDLRDEELLTVSAKLAMTALEEQDESVFEDSHMGRFLDILTNITKTNGAELKRKTPTARIHAAIDKVLVRFQEVTEELNQYERDLREKQRELTNRNGMLLEEMRANGIRRVEAVIRKQVAEVERTGSPISGEELDKLLTAELYSVILKSCTAQFEESQSVLSAFNEKLRVGGVGGLKMTKDKIEYEVQYSNRVKRDPDDLFEFFGSIVGKRYYRTEFHTETRVKEFDAGVNEQQILAVARDEARRLFDEAVPELLEKISAQYLSQITALLESAKNCIRVTQDKLVKLK